MGYVDGFGLQSALREMQRHFTDPRVLGAMAVVAAILGFSGPFGTFDYLTLLPRLGYWAAIVAATYGIGYFVGSTAGRALRRRLPRPALRIVLLGLAIGPPITLVVVVINWLTFGFGGVQPIDWLTLLVNCTIIAIGVNAISEIVAASIAKPAMEAPVPSAAPPILERLPVHLRGPLVALVVEDHYVDVMTTRGKHLLLIRLSDAMREVGDVRGVQIHRSHWVALDAVARVRQAGGKMTVELTNGVSLPVSRGFMPAAKEAGLVV